AVSLIPQKSAQGAAGAPVIVQNTPLPVQGTVAATQSGTWNVGLTGTPTVNVGTLPAVSLNSNFFQLTYKQPVTMGDVEHFVNGGQFSGSDLIYTVPEGKRLVVQYFSAEAFVPPGQAIVRQLVQIEDPNRPGFSIAALFFQPPAGVPCGGTCIG